MTQLDLTSREALFHAHRRLALCFAFRLARRSAVIARLDRDDLVSAACVGLLEAIDTWEPARGKLSTHAWWVIRRCVQREALHAGTISLPQEIFTRTNEDGSSSFSPAKRAKAIRAMSVRPYGRHAARSAPADDSLSDETLRGLDRHERQVLRLTYEDDLSYQACGKKLGMSTTGAWHLHRRAIAKLRERLVGA